MPYYQSGSLRLHKSNAIPERVTDPVYEDGRIDAKATEAIRGGWYLGEEGFKDKLLGLIDKAGARIRK